MAIVSFSLNSDGVASFQNALACILRFSEDVSLDARRDKLTLSALNVTKSASVSFKFSPNHFERYKFEGTSRSPNRFYCLLFIRALLFIFRARTGGEASKGFHREAGIERCDVCIDDGSGKKSRFIARIAWRNGITATHALPFEAKAPITAKFDKTKAVNHWAISAHTLRRLMEHFGPKVELLDINTEGDDVVNLTCFTEKQYVKTDGILKMNLHTSIAVKMDEFDDINVEEKHHIIINVKDFRAILQHACTTAGELSAEYSDPCCPLRFSYSENGMLCEFILMTVGDKAGSKTKKTSNKVREPRRSRPRLDAGSVAPSSVNSTQAPATHPVEPAPVPPRDASASTQHPSLRPAVDSPADFDMRPPIAPPPSTIRLASLYDDDSQWEPVNPDEDNPDFVQIEWDESLQPELTFVPISNGQKDATPSNVPPDLNKGLEPTQRLTQVRKFGLFD